ncbi:MAG TPA: hypothetical protein VGW75_05400 [Solirubrobacteraceae bacterium]|jgi:hypothetical protein|nr:hypothetical protein [Solirubrobacteraceae bacterium]
MQRLGLTDDELMAVLDADPISVIADQLDHRPEIGILLDLTAEAEERAGGEVLRRWLRTGPPGRRPLDLLLQRDFPAFEDALADLADRGFVLRSSSGSGGGGR